MGRADVRHAMRSRLVAAPFTLPTIRTKTEYDGERFTYPAFNLFVLCIFNVLCSSAALRFKAPQQVPEKLSIPWIRYQLIGICYVGAMYFSNASLKHVDYPTQVLVKSCKPIPVLLVGLTVFQKKYPWTKVLSVFVVAAGVASFMLNYKSGKSSNVPTRTEGVELGLGHLFLVFSLLLDGFTGPIQETVRSRYRHSSNHLMLGTNLAGLPYLIVGMLLTGDGLGAIGFAMRHPAVIRDLLAFALVSATGQIFIFATVSSFGALALTVITTTRKFFTIVLSVVLFGNELTTQQWMSVGVVFFGLGIDAMFKLMQQTKKKED